MADPITPEKLRELANSADEGELERFIDGAFIQAADALRAAADEIERLALKASIFDGVLANVPDTYRRSGGRVLVENSLLSHLAAYEAAWTIVAARDAYLAGSAPPKEG